MTTTKLKNRTIQLGVDVITLSEKLPRKSSGNVVEYQSIRAATSVGANYRAALRGRSKPNFISKLGIALEELDETQYWIEVAVKGAA